MLSGCTAPDPLDGVRPAMLDHAHHAAPDLLHGVRHGAWYWTQCAGLVHRPNLGLAAGSEAGSAP